MANLSAALIGTRGGEVSLARAMMIDCDVRRIVLFCSCIFEDGG